ncbi:lipopolysaccharide biosynthesis protein [Nonomuraea typhae]|uniref:lipopolysaccharide biosynthesis protein n=1 Tax=Nonomuraea typhae TaxID=2603600 RepID=UPI0012F7BB43|nr:polysaccharide biosynthesis C-terminal domain-containing protein [Nonomuraea typhae]
MAPVTEVRRAALGRVARSGAAGLTGAVAGAVAQFVLVVVVTRAFDITAAGSFFTAIALALMVAGVAKLDAGNGLIFFIARAKTYDYRGISGYVRAALVPGVLVASAAGILLHPQLGTAALILPAMVAADIILAATRGFGAMRPTVLYDGILLPAAQLALVTATALAWNHGLLTGPSPQSWLLAAWAAPYPFVLLLAALSLRGRLPRTPYLCGTAHDLWRYTAPRSAAGAIQAVFQRLDIVIVAMLAGPAPAAVYTAATRFKVIGQLANQGLAQAAQPRLIQALDHGDLPRARELYQATTMWLVLLTWPVWLGYAAVAPWLLRVFGSEYGAALPVALILSGTMMLATACGMVDVVLTAAGHTTASLVNLVVAITVTVLLDLALIPAHGALGAVLGWSGGVIVKNVLPLWQIHRRYGLRPFGRHSLSALRPGTWAAA